MYIWRKSGTGNENSTDVSFILPQERVLTPVIRYEDLKKRIRAEKNLPIEQRNTWVGFIPYDTGEAWNGIRRRSILPEVYFVPHQVVPGHKPRLEHLIFRLSKSEPIQSNLSKSAYIKKIKIIKEYLRSGDTYQVNFSQQFSTDFEGDPLSLFLALSKKNPSPYQFFCDTPEFSIISNSPERLVHGYRKD